MAAYKMTYRTVYGTEKNQTVFADSDESARAQAPNGVEILSVSEAEDPRKFRPSLFRREFLESGKRMDEDALAEFHAKVQSGEVVLDPTPAPEPAPEEEVLLEGRSKVGELLKYAGHWYVAVESYRCTIDTGEDFIDGGWETRARLATDDEITGKQNS